MDRVARLEERMGDNNARITALEAELAAERERREAAEAALRTIKKSTYICTVSLQDWQYCVLEVQRVADAAMKD